MPRGFEPRNPVEAVKKSKNLGNEALKFLRINGLQNDQSLVTSAATIISQLRRDGGK